MTTPDPGTPSSIEDYAGQWRALGSAEFARRYRDPVLVRRDPMPPPTAEIGYQTAVGKIAEGPSAASGSFRNAMASPLRGGAPPALVTGEVLRIAKRDGAAFGDRIGVGRARNVDVCLPLPNISKYHAFFTTSDDGARFFLTDAGSKNGTTVAGEALVERVSVELANGAEIAFGPYRFRFFTPAGFLEVVERRAAIG